MQIFINHTAAFAAGFVLDLLFGDPHWLPHPIRLIGNLIAALERKLNFRSGGAPEESHAGKQNRQTKNDGKDGAYNHMNRVRGTFLVLLVLAATILVTALILLGAYRIHPGLGLAVEAVMTYQILAAKSLRDESMKVYHSLKNEGLEAGRKAVSMIVGRDTDALNEIGVTKAAVETVAENTSDGVIAPMLYTALGGPILGFAYKAVNTMDSMIGYKNDRYLFFGRTAAKLDDIVNYLPARISAYLMILAAYLGGASFDGKQAYRIFRRDRYNHASPNSAQTESVCAGALQVQLAGDAVYFGKVVKKPFIGDPVRVVSYEDIPRANRLMYLTACICEALCILLLCAAGFLWGIPG